MVTTAPVTPVRRLWVSVLCGYLALGATIQILPQFVTTRFHGGSLMAGTAVGIAFLATAVARPFAGLFADSGHARRTVASGGVLGALGGLGHLWAPNFTVLLISRLLMGAGEAALFSGALPWVLAGAAPHRRGRVAGWFGLSMWSGLAAGPVLATVLDRWLSFSAVWDSVVALALMSALLVLATRSESGAAAPLRLPRRLRDVVPPGAPLPGLALGLASYGYGTVAALLVLHLQLDHIGGASVGLTVFALGFLLTRASGSPLVDRCGGARVAACCMVVEAAGLLTLALATGPGLALIGAAVAGVGVALMYPATVAITLHRTDALRPGAAVGAMTSFWDLGVMIAGPVGGFIAADFGYPLAFIVAVATAAGSFVLVNGLSRLSQAWEKRAIENEGQGVVQAAEGQEAGGDAAGAELDLERDVVSGSVVGGVDE
jgi:MFS family permease